MKLKVKPILFLATLAGSSSAWSWVTPGNTTIKEFVQWEGGTGNVVLRLESGKNCYVPLAEKELYSLVLALYMSGRTFNLHCYDTAVNINGYSAHKVHRINAVK